MKRILVIIFLLWGAGEFSRATDFSFYPETVRYNPDIPTLKQVVGHAWGEDITSYHEMERFIFALAEATPRVQVFRYGETWQGRNLYYLVVASEQYQARLEEIKQGQRRLSDPRVTDSDEARRLISDLPAVTWLAYGVHGNEISSPNAGLLTAYHLAAAEDDAVAEEILANSIVIIDPLQNPDGRQRFVQHFRQTRSRWTEEDRQAAEHSEPWPGGRTNHYFFDLNRDWFPLTQRETQAKVKAFLEWMPQVFVDLHEMGGDSTYYFPPQADPVNPNLTDAQKEWLKRFGENNARWFDRLRFDYFTREIYDSFYPGYGASWPGFHGAISMTYEQASARGLALKRRDNTVLLFRDGVQHHFIASIATCQTAASKQEEILEYKYNFHRNAIQEGQEADIREYLISPRKRPFRAAKLIKKLVQQGIEVSKSTAGFALSVRDYDSDQEQTVDFPAGTYLIRLDQPAKHLARVLLARQTSMDAPFIEEQLKRYAKRQSDQIYDITAWSLPLMYDLEAYRSPSFSKVSSHPVDQFESPGSVLGGPASLAYLVPWGTQAAAQALAQLQREKIRVFSADQGFQIHGRDFPSGSLIIKVRNNPEDLYSRLERIAAETGASFITTDSSRVEGGIDFGSRHVRYLPPPRIGLAYGPPGRAYSVGWARYLMEQGFEYPVTLLRTEDISRLDLSDYDVLVFPDTGFGGGYSTVLGEQGARKIGDWVRSGGVLVTLAGGTLWAADDAVGLLDTDRVTKGEGKDEPGAGAEEPVPVPGAILRVALDTGHWLASGYDSKAYALVEGNRILKPLPLEKGSNVGRFFAEENLLASGFIWEEEQALIAQKPFLLEQISGAGRTVGFTEDPNFRAFHDGLELLFFNALFLGPGR